MSNISFKMLALATIASLALSACTVTDTEVTPTTSASQTQIVTPKPAESSVTPDVTTPPANETAKPKESKKETEKPKATGKDTALLALETLAVKGRAPKTGYDRDLFGAAWTDVDRNGCDTRNDILARDLTDVTFKPGTNNCVVLSGYLADPFTGLGIHFERGNKTSMAVQIDHVIPLSDAWQKGAQQWDAEKRKQFANDPLNLLAVDGPQNGAKSDSDAASWLPKYKPARCDYIARQIAVKAKYGAWVTQAEKEAMVRVLSDCPEQKLPKDDSGIAVKVTGDAPKAKEKPVAKETSKPETPQKSGDLDPQFTSCAKAKEAGYGKGGYQKGVDPEYDWYRDGDNDGTVCE